MRSKLAKKTGAALVLALLFFLLCACVGTMVVTAASANMGKAAKMREDEQTYQAVKAAANAMARLMMESPYTVKYTEYYKKETTLHIAADGSSSEVVKESTSAVKESIRSGSSFPDRSKLADLLGNSVRNIYLKNTKLANGKELLLNVSEVGGGLPGPWMDTEVTDLGPDKYEWKIVVENFPDVLLTLEINKGSGDTANNLYEATITATDEQGNHMVVLCSPAKIPTGTTTVTDSGTGGVGDPRIKVTEYKTEISWVDWKAKQADGGAA